MRRITRTIRVPNPDYWTEERQRQTIEASGYEVEDFFPEDLEFSDEDGFNIHFLSENGAFDEQALFYLRSRGISKGEAQRMLLVNLKDPHYCYFTFADELRECFGEMTKRLGPKNHERRAAAHARKQSREGVSE